MAIYVNPTGTFSATDGDDTIIFNARPATTVPTAIDAIGGNDTLIVQPFDSPYGATFTAQDSYGGSFYLNIQPGPYDPYLLAYHVENLDLHGTANNDSFSLELRPTSLGLNVSMDGGAGEDLLRLDWTFAATALTFDASGSSIVSSFGTFSNFETFDLHGGSGNDTISTGAGNDYVATGGGIDIVRTGAGDDQIYSESSGGSVDAGDGFDIYSANFTGSAPTSVDIGETVRISNGIVVTNAEAFNIGTGSGDDQFTVNRAFNGTVYGGAGHDTLIYNGAATSSGQQYLVLTYDNGDLGGGIGSMAFQQFEVLSLTAGQFDDQFRIAGTWHPNDISFDGAAGIDSLSADFSLFTDATNFVVGADGIATGNRGYFANFEDYTLSGGSLADTITTGAGDDILGGAGGNDRLDGGAGIDSLGGGDGADTLIGGDGNDWFAGDDFTIEADVMVGGAGDDYYQRADNLDTIIEAADGGFDVVVARTDFVLADNVEALTLIDSSAMPWGSQAPIIGTGNAQDNSITGNDVGNILSGLDGNDMIIGGYGSDTISGGAGTDFLVGGFWSDPYAWDPWPDTFKDTAAGLNGDTIADFSIGDKIVISDADLANFTFSMSGNTLIYSGGSLNFQYGLTGHLVAQAAAGGGVQLTAVTRAVVDDFDGDGRSDMLWRSDSGIINVQVGYPNGSFNGIDTGLVQGADLDWQIAGRGDFNGDGYADILWRNGSGVITDWLGGPNASFVGNLENAYAAPPPDWHIAGTGDFNGDGRDDILWRNDAGVITDWLGGTNGGFTGNLDNAGAIVAQNWQIAGTGDFNGDGRTDILWRDHSGTVTDWLGTASGAFIGNFENANVSLTTAWQIVGVGDFNGDGRDDVLWRNSAGTVTDWLGSSSGGFIGNFDNAAINLATTWHLAQIGDFNGDRRDDILWLDGSGNYTDWLATSTGSFVGNFAHLNASLPPSWHVVTQAPSLI